MAFNKILTSSFMLTSFCCFLLVCFTDGQEDGMDVARRNHDQFTQNANLKLIESGDGPTCYIYSSDEQVINLEETKLVMSANKIDPQTLELVAPSIAAKCAGRDVHMAALQKHLDVEEDKAKRQRIGGRFKRHHRYGSSYYYPQQQYYYNTYYQQQHSSSCCCPQIVGCCYQCFSCGCGYGK